MIIDFFPLFLCSNQLIFTYFLPFQLVGLQAELARKKEEAERNQKTDQKKPTKLEIKPHIRVQLTRKPKATPKNDQFQDCTPEDTSLLNQARFVITVLSLFRK